MKRIITLILALGILAAAFAGCSKGETNTDTTEKADQSAVMRTVLNTTEYTLYQNIFFNDMAADYTNVTVTKEGTFATLYDAYNAVERYYVWGYNDETKCCDWQWEIKFDSDTDSKPTNGSFVKVTGEFVGDENALDKYWIIHPQIEVEEAYTSNDSEIDMSTMSATLERVEIQNIIYQADTFEGKTATLYGRVLSPTAVQHPYYDNAWELGVEGAELPDFGTMVLITGTVKDGKLTDITVSETTQY